MNDAAFGVLCTVGGAVAVFLIQFIFRRMVGLGDAEQKRIRDRVHAMANEMQNLLLGLERMKSMAESCVEAHRQVAELARELVSFKLHAAQTYVTSTWLQEAMQPVMSEIRHVADRMERIENLLDGATPAHRRAITGDRG